MKKITRFLAFAAIAALPFAFTSCDDDDYWDGPGDDYYWWSNYDNGNYGWNNGYYNGNDEDQTDQIVIEAQTLNGMWRGQMAYTTVDGNQSKTDYFNAEMTFVQNSTNATKGVGTEYDHYLHDNGKVVNDQTLSFNWYIDDTGDIYVKYGSGATFVMDISASQHGFVLDGNNGTFAGYMIGTNNQDLIHFDFSRVSSQAKANMTRTAATTSTAFFGSNLVDRLGKASHMSLPKNR